MGGTLVDNWQHLKLSIGSFGLIIRLNFIEFILISINTCYSIVTFERISSYKLANSKHDNESDPTCIIESAPPKR